MTEEEIRKAYIKKMFRIGNSMTALILPTELVKKIEDIVGFKIVYWRLRFKTENHKPIIILDPVEYIEEGESHA